MDCGGSLGSAIQSIKQKLPEKILKNECLRGQHIPKSVEQMKELFPAKTVSLNLLSAKNGKEFFCWFSHINQNCVKKMFESFI